MRIDLLDHGYVQVVRAEGDDSSIASTARTSTQSSGDPDKDARLVARLIRDKHTSPVEFVGFVFEVRCPIFVGRQWMRHRTGCLTGDTRLQFDLPGGVSRKGNQLYELTMKEVWDRFQPTTAFSRPDKQANPYFKRDRVQAMLLRSVNEDTGEVYHTHIEQIWKTGVKPVFEIQAGGKSIRASAEHRFLTSRGWLTVDQFRGRPDIQLLMFGAVAANSISQEVVVDEGEEVWRPLPDYEDLYDISNKARIRRTASGQGARVGYIKEGTLANTGYLSVSISSNAETTTINLHREMLRAFTGEVGEFACHRNGNKLDLRIENLYWGSAQDNSDDTTKHGTRPALGSGFFQVDSIKEVGEEETFDIEVTGPLHNFSANHFVVHNSFNEFSGRYSEFEDIFYVPELERVQAQSTFNKQGSAETLPEKDASFIQALIRGKSHEDFAVYKTLLDRGLTRELARVVLPTNFYTKFQWRVSLHNLFHFIKLREDPHAQYEIRVYAEALHHMCLAYFPQATKAFEDHIQNVVEISPELATQLAAALRLAGASASSSEATAFLRRFDSND